MAFDIYPQDVTVAEILKRHSITYTVRHCGVVERDGKQKMDHFAVSFTKRDNTFKTDFYQGSGHRKIGGPISEFREKAEEIGLSGIKRVDIAQHLEDFPMTCRERAKLPRAVQSVFIAPPTSGSVLNCLLSDARLADQNFYDFCDDLGLDPDSRKALAIYDACALTARDMRPIFRDVKQELETVLADY